MKTTSALRRQITLLEVQRDLRPSEWNAARELELSDLKALFARRTGREWQS